VNFHRTSLMPNLAAFALFGWLAVMPLAAAEPVGTDKAAMPKATVPAAAKPVFNDDGFQVVGFEQLASFAYTPAEIDPARATPPATATPDQIPEKIRSLDAKKVMVTGFMLPVKMDQGLVVEFLLVKDQMMCCYGAMPKLNEWVVVKMTGKGVPPLMDMPISFDGKLKVGELYDNGYLTGIYLLEGEKQAALKKG